MMKASYEQKMNWLHHHLPFIKLDHDLITRYMKTANSCITLANTQDSDANFYTSKKMLNTITESYCTYDVILNIHIFPDQTCPDHLVYSITITSAERNFITETYNDAGDFIDKHMGEDSIKFSRKEFLMVKTPKHADFVETMLNKLILLFLYPRHYQEYDNFFDEKTEDDITLIAMAAI